MTARPSSRRDFLKTSTAAAGALMAAPYAFSRTKAFNEVLKIGVIGTGGMGTGHLKSLLGHNRKGNEKLQVVALADVAKPRVDGAAKIASEGQDECEVRAYRDYRDMLAREKELHAVWVASPEHWHDQTSIDAIRAGLDVYVEKPMTLDLNQAMKLWRVERAHDRIVQVGTQYTTQPNFHHAQKLIAEGAIGTPVTSQTSYCRNTPAGEWNYYQIDPEVVPGPNLDWDTWCGELGPMPFDTLIYHRWRRYRRFSTGIIGDLLVHETTPMVMALDVGWPVRVTATGGHYVDKAMENHDTVSLTVQFEKGHTMTVMGSTCNETGLDKIIRGNKANLYLGGNHCRLVPERAYAEEVEEDDFQYEYEDPQKRHQLDFLRSVRTREKPRSTVELGTKIMVIVDLAARSMWEGAAFGYSPASMSSYRI